MDDIAARPADRLYDDDFYAWTQRQAGLLRERRVVDADWPNILEEIETLGRKEIAELRSRFTVLLQHLFKQTYQPEKAGRSWATTVLNQRIEIARHIADNPSLKAKLAEIFVEAYSDARALAAEETGLPVNAFPEAPPFTREQALDRTFVVRPDPSGSASLPRR